MSSVRREAGGFVIVSQVSPQNDGGPEGPSRGAPASLPKPIVAFYRGEPEVLGTTQLFAGILLITLGIPMIILLSRTSGFLELVTISGIPIWSGILYIICGSLSVAASVKPTLGKVRVSLVMNIFSSLAAICGIILAALDIALAPYPFYSGYAWRRHCAHYNRGPQCLGAFTPWPVEKGIMSYILLLFMLMFCITISTSVFACRTVCRTSFQEMSVVIYQTTSVNVSDATRDVPPDYTAAVTPDSKTQT